jgi:hypothetical protein
MTGLKILGSLLVIIMAAVWLGAAYIFFVLRHQPILGFADVIGGVVVSGVALMIAWRTNGLTLNGPDVRKRLTVLGYGLAATLTALGMFEIFVLKYLGEGSIYAIIGPVMATVFWRNGKDNVHGA